ncbi:hypothetical protein F5Y12DRAFT_715287 [Xylaria sp. FL1777]|nr:hypothetical protein F5Y12DRAFT_715287 [Xylaria sp. FL1777]
MHITTTEIPTLPPVEHERVTRTFKRPPTYYPYSFLETLKYYTGTDADLIWGPFYKRFRAARRERTSWVGFSLNTMWDGIPAAAQTRPGKIGRFFNWLAGKDPAPTLTPPPRSGKKRTTHGKTTRKSVDSWQQGTELREDWSPSQIDFTEWYGRLKHPVDYDDEFYRTNYQALYHKVCDFAEVWFGAGVYLEDLRDSIEDISAWEAPMTEQFIQYARIVAHEDHGYVNWKDIMNDPRHRKWLCVGILSQIIERKIFGELLFGAGEMFQHELERHDTRWILQEGFTRKDGRRQIARLALGSGLVPDHFWDAVDDLAGQTVLIFQPLLMLVALGSGRATAKDEAMFWQEVHTILAMAGYFQVCMAVSPSIFHVLSASPSARFQWEEEAHADTLIYKHSKEFHRSHEERWRVIADVSSKNDSAMVTKLVESMSEEDDASLYMPFPMNDDEYRLIDHERRRGGKVMYAVFPKLTRYTAENVGEVILDSRPATSQEIQMTGEGMRISLLSRCMVVYYQGLIHASSYRGDGISLDEHLSEISRKRMIGNFLPYWRHYWDSEGNPAAWFHWPVWPESVDKYWLYWLCFVVIGQFVKWKFGVLPIVAQKDLLSAVLYQPILWGIVEVATYVVIRSYKWSIFRGRGLFWKVRLFNFVFMLVTELLLRYKDENVIFFSLLITPLIWMDKFLLNKLPAFIMSLAGVVENEDASTLFWRLFSQNNATAAGY